MRDRRRIRTASTRARAHGRGPWGAALAVALTACASGETPGASERGVEGSQLGSLPQALSSDAGGASDAAPPGPSNDCCTASDSGGCSDAAVAACVCEGDPFCCGSEYDALCVKQAVSRCGQDCDDRPPLSDCCSASSVPGCTDGPVAACICEIDPFCCVFRFDQNCVNLGVSRCNLSCGEEEARP